MRGSDAYDTIGVGYAAARRPDPRIALQIVRALGDAGRIVAYWRRPEAYLDPGVRAGISSLAALAPAALEPGLTRLRADIASGAWQERHADLLARDEVDLGYRLLIAG